MQLQWRDLDTFGAVISVVRLPGASINRSQQKKPDCNHQLKETIQSILPFLQRRHIELQDMTKQGIWQLRPGRSIAEQVKRGIAAFRKLKSFVRVVGSAKLTGNPPEKVIMRCAVGMYNHLKRPSHFYDVMRKPSYNVGKQFPYPITFKWLDKERSELAPHPLQEKVLPDNKPANCTGTLESADDPTVNNSGPPSSVYIPSPHPSSFSSIVSNPSKLGSKRQIRKRAGKAANKMKYEMEAEKNAITEALSVWTSSFKAANHA